jgi:hypothetical protein
MPVVHAGVPGSPRHIENDPVVNISGKRNNKFRNIFTLCMPTKGKI